MKKGMIMFLLVLSVSIFLMGCSSGNKNGDDDSLIDSFKRTQKIEVVSPEGDVITSISDDKDIENFINALKIEDWNSANIPLESTKGNTFKMYQEDTVKLGESGKQKGNLNEIAHMVTYKDVPYITIDACTYKM